MILLTFTKKEELLAKIFGISLIDVIYKYLNKQSLLEIN
jgi:hypothetical protein